MVVGGDNDKLSVRFEFEFEFEFELEFELKLEPCDGGTGATVMR